MSGKATSKPYIDDHGRVSHIALVDRLPVRNPANGRIRLYSSHEAAETAAAIEAGRTERGQR